MQILSVISALTVAILVLMNYHNTVQVNILSNKFAQLMNMSAQSITLDLAIVTFAVFILGAVTVLCFFMPLYNSLKNKYAAYKRELERGSITNTSSEAKIKVLENKITVLEKALDDALKKRS